MFPWNILRAREEGKRRGGSAVLAQHMYQESMKDTAIALRQGEQKWWNEVLCAPRKLSEQRRADKVRECLVAIKQQTKTDLGKRKREHVERCNEIVID